MNIPSRSEANYQFPSLPRNEAVDLSDCTPSSIDLLAKAKSLQEQRAKDYDQPGGERSMGKAVAAFNIITESDLTESEGWLLMQILKDVRDRSVATGHVDSIEDCVSYAALKGEARLREGATMRNATAAVEAVDQMRDGFMGNVVRSEMINRMTRVKTEFGITLVRDILGYVVNKRDIKLADVPDDKLQELIVFTGRVLRMHSAESAK